MSKNKDNKDPERLEQLLRQWGVREAASQIQPRTMKTERRWLPIVVRWAPVGLAAAAALAAVFMLGYFVGSPLERAPEEAELQEAFDKLSDEHAVIVQQLQDSQRQVQDQTARAQNALADVKRLQDRFSAPDAKLTELEKQVKRYQQDLDLAREQQRLTLAALEVAKKAKPPASNPDTSLPTDVAALQDKVIRLEAQVENDRDGLASAKRELTRLKGQSNDWAQKVQKAQDELEAIKVMAKRQFESSQAAYLQAAAPSSHGLKARQIASKRARLVQRVTAILRGGPAEAVKPVLTQVETALTRLEMLDPNDTRSVAVFAKLLDNGGLLQKMDEVIASDRATPETQAVLAEARVILAGAENA